MMRTRSETKTDWVRNVALLITALTMSGTAFAQDVLLPEELVGPPKKEYSPFVTANFTNSIGASELGTVWTDPAFDSEQKAFYYARVIEIPTPRWSTIYGVKMSDEVPMITRERAYTSPIWYTP